MRPIRLLVPFAPGGGADALSRIITPKLHDALGQAWVVDNRGGAAGNIAAETVAKAAPDGYTALMGFSTVLTVNPSLYKLPYSVEKDLQPVTLLATAQYILVIHPSVAAGTLKEFIALAKQKPGSLNYASAGVGSPLHLAAELFKKRAGINMVHLAYKGGGPAAAAVLAGEAQVLFASVASSIPQVKAGRLKALATTGTQALQGCARTADDCGIRFSRLRREFMVRAARSGRNRAGHREPHPRCGDEGGGTARRAGSDVASGPGRGNQHAAGTRGADQNRVRGVGGRDQGSRHQSRVKFNAG